jgi:hypothetical protein
MKTNLLLVIIGTLLFTCTIFSCINDDNFNAKSNLDSKTNTRTEIGIGNSCAPNIDTTLSCQPGSFPSPIQLPQYPGCTFYINLQYTLCADWASGIQRIYLSDFTLIEHDCPQYDADVAAAMSNNSLDTLIAQFNGSVWQYVTNILLAQSAANSWSVTILEYNIVNCVQTCFVEKRSDFSSHTGLVPVVKNCGEDCCQMARSYRIENGEWILRNESITNGDTCSPIIIHCPTGTQYYTDCIYNCTQFLFF